MIYNAGYDSDGRELGCLYDLEDTVRLCVKSLRPHLDKFDTIAVRGMSGTLAGAPTALILKKELFVARKDVDRGHTTQHVNGNAIKLGANRCIFLDDFISSGSTKTAVRDAVEKFGGRLVGDLFYSYADEDDDGLDLYNER